MSAPVDSLSIKVDTSARSANQQLDKLVQKMVQLRSTVNGINVGNLSKMATSIQDFSKAATGLNQVKTSDFTRMAKNIEKLTNVNSSNLDKSARSVEKAANSLQRASSVSKKAISSGLKFDTSGVQDMQKAIQSLSNEYANVGKGKQFSGTLSELEKQADRLRKHLDDLAEKEEEILTVGGTSAENKTFKRLQYNISKTMNQLSELEDKIAQVRAAEKQDISSIPIFRYDATAIGLTENSGLAEFKQKTDSALKEIPESAKYSVEAAQKSLQDALKKVHIGDSKNSGFRNYTEEIKNLEANLKKLEQSGKGMGSDEWEQAYLALRKVTLEANEYKYALDHPVTELDEEIRKTDSLGNHIEALKAKLKDMQAKGLNFGDPKFDSTYKELQKSTAELKKYKTGLNDAGNTAQSVSKKIGDAFRSIWSQTKKAGSGVVAFGSKVKSLTTHFHSMSSSTSGLIGKLMKLYIGLQSLKGVASFLKDSVESSMDYIEAYNYFDDVFGKISKESSKDWKKYGYENAEAYQKSFKSRATDMFTKMTGFQIGQDGTLEDIGIKNLGLDITEMANYATSIANLTDSVGIAGEASMVASKAMSMLAGDMSAFRNMDMSKVMQNFQSGLTGSSEALYKYGIDITNATLASYAHDMGIRKNISDMTQMEKMQLRMIAILDQSRNSWGYLAKEINSPSNQLRLLNNNFKSLSRTIGAIFMPVVAKVLPYINGLVIAIRRLFEWSASLLGIDISKIIKDSGVGGSDAFDGIEEDADNASDAVDDTTDSVKKLAKQLMGFDELNVITTNKGSSSDKDDDKDSKPIDLTSQLSAALADYEKVWNEAYENMTSDAEKFADKLTKLFKSAWLSGDGSDIGSAIAKWLNRGLKWVNDNWSVADEKVQKIANILATAVNGFTYEFDWSGLGKALSNTLQTWLNGETTFFDNTDWTTLGEGIATSLNSFIGDGKKGPIQSYFKNLGSKLRAAIEFAFGTITTFKFDNLGKAIGQGINDFLDKMGKVNPKTKKNGWQELATSISEGIKGIATTITTALDDEETWKKVGQAIADFITGIDWKGVVWSMGSVVQSFATALKNVLKGAGMNDTLANLVVNVGIGGWIIKKLSKTVLGKAIAGKLGNKFSVPLQKVGVTVKNWFSTKKGVALSKLKSVLSNAIGKFSLGLKKAWASIRTWVVGEAKIAKLKEAIIGKVGKLSVWFKNVWASIKSWRVGETKTVELISKIKTGLGLTKGTFSLGKIATKIAVKVPTFIFPDPATDELVRKIDEGITKHLEMLPGYNSETGIFTLPKQLLVDFPMAIGDFAFNNEEGSTGKTLQEAFNKFMTGGEGGTPSITALVKYLSDDESAEKVKKKIPDNKTVTATFKAKTIDKSEWLEIYKKFNSTDSKTVMATFKAKTGDNWTDKYKKYTKLANKTTNWKLKALYENEASKTLMNNPLLSTSGKNAVLKKTIKVDIQVLANSKNAGDKFTAHALESIFGSSSKKAGGGVFSGGSWHNIAKYANGGLPGIGQMFVAREAGPELVGTIGGHTAVMNNNQIVASVSDGIFNALAPILTHVANSINALNSKIDNMGDGMGVEKYTEGDLLRVIRKEDSNYRKRTGKSAFAY